MLNLFKGIIMSRFAFFSLVLFFLISSAHSKIVTHNGAFFIINNQERVPLFIVNQLVEKNEISRIKLYGAGNAHLISFSKVSDKKEKLYSVDEKGFIYSINPFTEYTVTEVDEDGKFKFREVQDKKFFVNKKGFFLH